MAAACSSFAVLNNTEITTSTRNEAARRWAHLKGIGTADQADEGQCDLGTILVWAVSIVVVAAMIEKKESTFTVSL